MDTFTFSKVKIKLYKSPANRHHTYLKHSIVYECSQRKTMKWCTKIIYEWWMQQHEITSCRIIFQYLDQILHKYFETGKRGLSGLINSLGEINHFFPPIHFRVYHFELTHKFWNHLQICMEKVCSHLWENVSWYHTKVWRQHILTLYAVQSTALSSTHYVKRVKDRAGLSGLSIMVYLIHECMNNKMSQSAWRKSENQRQIYQQFQHRYA